MINHHYLIKTFSFLLLTFCLNIYSFSTELNPIKNLFDTAEDAANGIVNNAANRLDQSVYNVHVNALWAIKTLKEEYKDVLDKTIDEIGNERRKTLNNSLNVINKAIADAKNGVEDLNKVIDSIATALKDITRKNNPLVRKINSSPIISSITKSNVIRFFGSKLHHQNNHIIVNGNKIKPDLKHIDTEIAFDIPTAWVKDQKKVKIELVLHHKSGWLFFGSTKATKYIATLPVVPKIVGKASLVYIDKITTKENSSAKKFPAAGETLGKNGFLVPCSQAKGTLNPFKGGIKRGSGNRKESFITPRGWRLNLASLKSPKQDRSSNCSNSDTKCTISNRNESGFQLNMTSKTAKKVGARCYHYCYVTYTLYKHIIKDVEKDTDFVSISWSNPVSISFPPDKVVKFIRFKMDDGKEFEVNPDSPNWPWLKIFKNQDAGVLEIKLIS